MILPDDIILSRTDARSAALAQMIDAYGRAGDHIVATEYVPADRISSYGGIDMSASHGSVQILRGLMEKTKADEAPSSYGIVGRYIFEPSIFAHFHECEIGCGGEIHLTDAIAHDLWSTDVLGFAFDGTRFHCGSVAGYVEATLAFAQTREDVSLDRSLAANVLRAA